MPTSIAALTAMANSLQFGSWIAITSSGVRPSLTKWLVGPPERAGAAGGRLLGAPRGVSAASTDRHTAVNRQNLARHHAGLRRGEIERRVGDMGWLAEADKVRLCELLDRRMGLHAAQNAVRLGNRRRDRIDAHVL